MIIKKNAIKIKGVLRISKNELKEANKICFSSRFLNTPIEDYCTNVYKKYHQYESSIIEIDKIISIYDHYKFRKYVVSTYTNINNKNIFIFVFSMFTYLTYFFIFLRKKELA